MQKAVTDSYEVLHEPAVKPGCLPAWEFI